MTEIVKLLAGIILSLQALLGAQTPAVVRAPVLNYVTTTISVGNTKIIAKVSDTDEKRAQGLSGTKPLGENEGMLFIFDRPDYYQFWMKDMNYSLDIIWLDSNYKIVDITKNLTPVTYPQTFKPQQPARYVLEIRAGFSQDHHLKIGEGIVFSN